MDERIIRCEFEGDMEYMCIHVHTWRDMVGDIGISEGEYRASRYLSGSQVHMVDTGVAGGSTASSMSMGVLMLLKIFFLRPVVFKLSDDSSEVIYDLVSYVFLYYKKHWVLPDWLINGSLTGKLRCVMESDDVVEVLNEFFEQAVTDEGSEIHALLQMGDTLWGLRVFIRQELGQLEVEDINKFVRIMVQNKILDDKQVNQVVGLLSGLIGPAKKQDALDLLMEKYGGDAEKKPHNIKDLLNYEKNAAGLYTEIYLDSLMEEEFTKIELEAWKANVQEKYHPYIDDIGVTGLMNMKRLFTDFFGDPFLPRGWQRWTLGNLRRRTTIVSCRRGWKTYFGAYLCARQLYLPNQTIVYVVPTLKNQAGTPFRYLEMFFGDDTEIQMDRSQRTIRHKKLKSEIIFLSAERDTNVRSQAANLIVYDEAAFISEKVYETASALVRTTKGMVYIISTVNPDTPKNRFYYKLLEAEIEMFNAHHAWWEVSSLARRITLHDNPFIDEAEKRSIIKDGQRNPKLFGAEWMCEFQESEDFDLKNFWKIDEDPIEKQFAQLRTAKLYRGVVLEEVGGQRGKNTYDKFYVSYDAAKRKDQPALVVVGVKKEKRMVDGIMDVEVPVAEVVCSGYMSNLEYYEQVKVLVEVWNYFGGRQRVDMIVELNNTGIVIEELLRREHQIFAIGITAIGGTVCKREGGNWNVGTKLMLWKIKSAMSLNQLKGYSFMTEMRMEFESYDEESVAQRKDGHHFDILSALRGAVRYISKTGMLLGDGEESYEDRYEDPRGQAFSMPQAMLGGNNSERGRFGGGGF